MKADELLIRPKKLHWQKPFVLANHSSQSDSKIMCQLKRKFPVRRPYSVLNACIGSRREARQAGKMQANKAIKSRVRITAPITAGSDGLVP